VYLPSTVQDAIHVVETAADGSIIASSRRLTLTEGLQIPGGWLPDNRSFVFVTNWHGRPTVVRQATDAAAPQPVADEAAPIRSARLTPDGTAILYSVGSAFRDQRLMRVATTGGASHEFLRAKNSFVNGEDGGARCAIAPATLCAIAEWSDDGRQFVFTSIDGVTGRRDRELARLDPSQGVGGWTLSPDATRIAVVMQIGTVIRILSISGLPPQELTVEGAPRVKRVDWASDSARLLVSSIEEGGASLRMIDLHGRGRLFWHQPGAVDIEGIPSRDGHYVAIWVRSQSANLWLVEDR